MNKNILIPSNNPALYFYSVSGWTATMPSADRRLPRKFWRVPICVLTTGWWRGQNPSRQYPSTRTASPELGRPYWQRWWHYWHTLGCVAFRDVTRNGGYFHVRILTHAIVNNTDTCVVKSADINLLPWKGIKPTYKNYNFKIITQTISWKLCWYDEQVLGNFFSCCVFLLVTELSIDMDRDIVHCWRPLLRADSRLAPSQWETLIESNAVSLWLSANLESALLLVRSEST